MSTFRGIKQLLAAVVIVSFGALPLSGCAAEAVVDTPPTQRSTPSSTPSATPSEKPTSMTPAPVESEKPVTSEIDLANPGTWLISADGIGPVLYGGAIADVRPSMTAFTEIPSDWCGVARFRSEENGLAVLAMLSEDGSTIEGTFVNRWGQSPAALAAAPRTAEGIGLGSSLSDLLSAYPTISLEHERATEPPTLFYAIRNANGSWLVFVVYEDVVGAIAVHNEPWLMSEYCA